MKQNLKITVEAVDVGLAIIFLCIGTVVEFIVTDFVNRMTIEGIEPTVFEFV